jgi:mono/diheme cytochrome c family protein
MFTWIYNALEAIGYAKPLHPPLTNVPIGVVIAAFVFGLVHWAFRRPSPAQTARHCLILVLAAWFPTVFLGYLDWQHRLDGIWVFPIVMKMILAGALLILLVLGVVFGRRGKNVLGLYALCFLVVVGLGYFGGELVYGRGAAAPEAPPKEDTEQANPVQQGAAVFARNCSQCHFPDRKEPKIGPGLAGVLKGDQLPVSGRPATEENVRHQLRSPYNRMPSFAELPEEKVDALIAYLKTL